MLPGDGRHALSELRGARTRGATCSNEAVLGLIFQSARANVWATSPLCAELDQALLQQLDSLDVLLFDGTFWSDDELIRFRVSGQTARQMGHVPVGSAEGSLHLLSKAATSPKDVRAHQQHESDAG